MSDNGDAISAMEPPIAAAANALAAGDPLRALNFVALRDDAPAIALRGIAMARLGDLTQARKLLKRAAKSFGRKHPVAHARCVLAEAEIAFVSRDLGWPLKPVVAAQEILEKNNDTANATHACHLRARRFLLLGKTDEAERLLATIDPAPLSPPHRAIHEMILADLSMRRLRIADARLAFDRAKHAAERSGIDALKSEIGTAAARLDQPAARWITGGNERPVLLEEVAALLLSGDLVIDACRRFVRRGKVVVPLAGRPVLFSIARSLAEAWPGDVPRIHLIRSAFGGKQADESHRIRLRVEIGRLRRLLKPFAEIGSTGEGYILRPKHPSGVHVLTWPSEEEHGAVLAFLADGEAWSSSALALALGVSQRTVQRSLDTLAAEKKVQWFGRARARRWTAPSVSGFTTTMLLPSILHRM